MDEQILSLISKVTNIEISKLKENMDSVGLWDSFSHIELVVNLESEFGITFKTEEITELNTPNKIVNIVMSKVK